MPIAIAQYLDVTRVSNSVINALSPEAMLSLYLGAHPKVANAIFFEGQHVHGKAWPDWPDGLKTQLADRWKTMVTWYGQGMPSPDPSSFTDPLPVDPGDPNWNGGEIIPAERGRHVYLSHVANGLALETTGALPWSMTGYNAKHLADLFSTTYWIEYMTPPDVTVEGYYFAELMSPATPAHVMRFFKSNDILGTSARDTVTRLFGWCRILIHYYETQTQPADPHLFWGPDSPPIPASLLINGSNYTGQTPPVPGRYTMGCGGTAGFMKSVLRAVNIPVEFGTPPCGHVMPLFPTMNRAMSHGDDPYDRTAWFTDYPGWPTPALKEYLITLDEYNQWFDPSLDPGVMINNVARRPVELAVQYQSDWLLDCYCQDTAANLDHAHGSVYDTIKNVYTLAQAESMQLWDKLAAKATATNFCATASARPPMPARLTAHVRHVEPAVMNSKSRRN